REAADLAAIRRYAVTIDGRPHHIVRGDFHRHTGLSWDGGGGLDGSLSDFYRYMIDCASMDFGASTDHQGGAWPYWWWYSQKMTDMHMVAGAYVPIFGYERSALYPDGHRNGLFATRAASRVTPFFLRDSGKTQLMADWKGPMAGAQSFGLPRPDEGDEPNMGTGALAINDTRLLYEEV